MFVLLLFLSVSVPYLLLFSAQRYKKIPISANYLVRRSSLFILHHFPFKPKLEHAVGDEDAVLLQGNQFLVDEGFLDAVDIGFAAQRIGFCYSLSSET